VAARTHWEDNNLNKGESPRNASTLISPRSKKTFDLFKKGINDNRGSSETRSMHS